MEPKPWEVPMASLQRSNVPNTCLPQTPPVLLFDVGKVVHKHIGLQCGAHHDEAGVGLAGHNGLLPRHASSVAQREREREREREG